VVIKIAPAAAAGVAESLKSNSFPKGFQLPLKPFTRLDLHTTSRHGSDRINVDSLPYICHAGVKDLHRPSYNSKYGTQTLLHGIMRVAIQQLC
jgi:hypothetical protein